MLPTSGTALGGYRIEGRLGRGGMGVVYQATQLSLGRTVALKVLAPELSGDERFRGRFRREARIQAAIDHAHIVSIHEAGELDDGSLFIAMQLIRGPNLKEVIAGGELTPERTLRLLTPVADALDTAHEAGLVHRDVKSQNVLVGPRDHAYLADFGLTRRPDDTKFTRTGAFVGTLDYAAPEQIQGAPTERTDLYAFAAVLFECLTGRVPFERQNEAALIMAHLTEAPPHASRLAEGLPGEVDPVLQRALAKDPSERHDSTTALMSDLVVALDVERRSSAAAAPPEAAEPAEPVQTTEAVQTEEPVEAGEDLGEDTLPVDARGVDADPVVVSDSNGSARLQQRPAGADSDEGADGATELLSRPGGVTRLDRRRSWGPRRSEVAAAPSPAARWWRGRLVPWLALALLPFAAGIGVLAAQYRSDTPSPSSPAAGEQRTLKTGGLSVRVPSAWRDVDTPRVPGLSLADANAAGPAAARRGDGLVMGWSQGSGPTLLPPSFSERLADPPEVGDPVRLGAVAAYRYADLRPRGLEKPLTIFVAPTDRGVATVACLGGAVRPSCGRTAASLRLGDGIRSLPLGPSRSYASRMTAVLRRLQRDRRRALSDLRAADSHRGQSRAATKVAGAHKRAASALRRTTRTPLERRAHLNLLTATERAGSAWRSLALAARRDEPSRYARARTAVRRRDRLLSRRVAALGELGYTVR